MEKNISLTFLMLFFVGIVFSQRTEAFVIPNQWIEDLNIDGKLDDWPANSMLFDKKVALGYGVANNSNNLYITIRTNKIGKVNLGGVKVVIDHKKDNISTKSRTILYPVPQNKEKANKSFEEIKVYGFPEIPDSILSIYNEYGIQAGYKSDGKELTIEFVVPLELLSHSIDGKTIFDLQLILEGFKISPQMLAALASSNLKVSEGNLRNDERMAMLDLYTADKVIGRYRLAILNNKP